MSEIPITVYDCGVFLQGLLSKASPAVACLELVEQDRIRLVMSEAVLAEIKDNVMDCHPNRIRIIQKQGGEN